MVFTAKMKTKKLINGNHTTTSWIQLQMTNQIFSLSCHFSLFLFDCITFRSNVFQNLLIHLFCHKENFILSI